MMTVHELALKLRRMADIAPRGDKTLYVQLFAIKYADELSQYPGKVREVIAEAEIGDYTTAINDMRKLAGYVTLNNPNMSE